MKKSCIFSKALVVLMFTALLLSLGVFADNEPTQQKTVTTYNTDTGIVSLEYYIASETAIVGYSSFDYDSSVLTLLDKNGNTVPDAVPKHSSDGSSASYLCDVVETFNNTLVTDVGRGAEKLINTDEGYVFFAWMLPSNYPFIDATKNDALIAKINFKVKDGVSPDKITQDCIKVATKSLTSNVSGWYAGLVVMNKNQKRSSYDGETVNKALYISEFKILGDGAPQEEPKQDDEPVVDEEPKQEDEPATDEEPKQEDEPATDEEPKQEDEPATDEEPKQEDEPATDEEPKQEDEPATDEEPKQEDEPATDEQPKQDDEPATDEEPKQDDEPATDEEPKQEDEPATDEEPKQDDEPEHVEIKVECAKSADFDIVITAETNSARIKWTKPEKIEEVISYTIMLLDEDYHTVREISGISGVSSSYTIENLASDYSFIIYITAETDIALYASDTESFMTEDEGDEPTTIVSNVFYDSVDGYLYGLSSELVMFGDAPTKYPEIIPEKGKYFIGWSKDGVNVIDIESERIYKDTLFTAIYSDKKPTEAKTYINGYEDGTFIPEGNITRAEAATIISRLCDDYDANKKYSHNFSDCKEGFWYENPIAFCQKMGYIKGYEDGTFNPDGHITRAEFATILFRVFGFEGTLGINVFSDIDGHWGKDNIAVLYSAGVITPDESGRFNPDTKLTRQDAVAMINRSLGTIPDRRSILESVKKNGYRFSDVPQYSQYFYDIMTAVMKSK